MSITPERSKYLEALILAGEAHEGQVIKGTAIPYITHPVGVARLVGLYGGDIDQQIAGLLHDTLEDGGPHYRDPIYEKFGPSVLAIVEGCTDGVPDASGKKEPWKERKVRYLQHLASADSRTLLVSGCDKLFNAQAIVEDLRRIGTAVFERFTAKREGTLWYYGELAQIFTAAGMPMAGELSLAVMAMYGESGAEQLTERAASTLRAPSN